MPKFLIKLDLGNKRVQTFYCFSIKKGLLFMFNKKMLTSWVVAGGLSLGSMVSAMAQPAEMTPPPPPPGGIFGPAVGPLGYMFENLNLSAEQQAKAKVIVDSARLQGQTIHQKVEAVHRDMANALLAPGKVTKGNLDPFVEKLDKLHRENAENHTKTLLALRNILTPDQLVQLKARLIKMKDIHGQMQLLRGQMRQTATNGTATPMVAPNQAQ